MKFEQNNECGGGYIKLVGTDFDPEEFGGKTPTLIMFGPDVCGSDNKIHLMLDFDGEGKLWSKTPVAPTDHMTHIYTMILYPNETYEVFLDMESIGNGTVSEDWEVSIPKMIPDPNDVKPEDWDDRMYLDDEDSVKPDDWVEEEMIEDSTATKPEDWDDEKEGEWRLPMIKNPAYKGEWKPKKIYNTNYKGVWTPKKIPNPAFKDQVLKPYVIGGVGIDVWQVKDGTLYDNIMIADNLEEAFDQAKKIIDVQVAEEKVYYDEEQKEREMQEAEEQQRMKENMEQNREDSEDVEDDDDDDDDGDDISSKKEDL